MKFGVDDKNRCRLVCVKFHSNRCRFAAAVAKCLGGSLFGGHSVEVQWAVRQWLAQQLISFFHKLVERRDKSVTRV